MNWIFEVNIRQVEPPFDLHSEFVNIVLYKEKVTILVMKIIKLATDDNVTAFGESIAIKV